jgi:hypothetical protein
MRNPRVQAQSPDAADPVWGWGSSLALAVVVGCVYTLAAKMSLALLTPDGVAVFWPAAGVAAGTLIALGPNARWGVVAGTMVATVVANLLGDRNLESSIVFALCNAGEALLTAGIIERSEGNSCDGASSLPFLAVRQRGLWCENTTQLTSKPWAYLKVLQTAYKQLQPTQFDDLCVLRQ